MIASFEWFRDRSALSAPLDENRDLLKDKIGQAKILGERANQSRYVCMYALMNVYVCMSCMSCISCMSCMYVMYVCMSCMYVCMYVCILCSYIRYMS